MVAHFVEFNCPISESTLVLKWDHFLQEEVTWMFCFPGGKHYWIHCLRRADALSLFNKSL